MLNRPWEFRAEPTHLRERTPRGALQSLSYELAGHCLPLYARSHSCRSASFSRPTCLTLFRLYASVPPRFVSKSVAIRLSFKTHPPPQALLMDKVDYL